MGEGEGLSLYMLIGVIMLGLFLGAIVIVVEEEGSFEGGLVETVKDIEPNEGGGIVEDDPNCVLATDEDFSGTVNGEFRYIGSSDCVKIPHVIKGVDVTSYKDMFRDTKVSKVVSDNPNVTDMSWMFVGSKATELDLSNFDTSNVTDMEWMFAFSQATELDLSRFDTSNVTNMGSMFSSSKDTELDLSSFDTSNVTDMSFMFSSSQATELDLSSFDTRNVKSMTFMFSNSQAETVYVRTQADADKFNAPINLPNGLQLIVKDREPNEGIVEDDPNCVIATDDDFSGTTNGSFRYIGSADCVEIPHVIKGVEVTSYQSMFSGTSVSKVVSDNLNVTNMSAMFSDSQATELDLSSFDTSNVTDMLSMFSKSQATGIDLSSFNTSKVTTMMDMFYESQATELDLSSFDTSNVTDMSHMFTRSQATELDLSSFDTSNVTNMRSMFSYSQATELDLSSFNTSNVTDMEGMFYGSQAKTVHARTQADADKFNESGN